jgi:peptide/nickel transport system substrate-binding protein
MLRRLRIVCAIGVCGMIAGLTLAYAPSAAQPAAARAMLRIAPVAGLSGLDPESGKAIIDIIVASQLYDTLLAFDETGRPIPALATAWKSTGPTTWELSLRRGVKFHDGTPFDAAAVKFNIERATDSKRAGRYTLFVPYIDHAEVVDDYTVRIVTKGQIPYLPYIIGYGFLGIVSPKAAAARGADFARNPVGTGPFKFVRWVEGQSVEMAANDDYWGGRPKLSGITWRLIPSESARVLALRAGEVDAIADPPTEMIPQLQRPGQFDLIRSVANAFVGVWLNPAVEPLGDLRIRQAVFHAIDQQAILENVIRGVAQPAYQILGPAVFGMFTDQQIPKGGFYPYDAAKAKTLLADTGWKPGPDGLVEQNGKKLSVVVQTPDGRYLKDRQIAEVVASNLRAVGIDARLQVMEFPTLSTAVTQHRVEVFILSWGFPTGYPEPGFFSVFHSSAGGGPAVWAQWRNTDADRLMDKALTEPYAAVRQELYRKTMQVFMNNAVIKPLYWKPIIWAVSKSVRNLKFLHTEEPAKMIPTEIVKQ